MAKQVILWDRDSKHWNSQETNHDNKKSSDLKSDRCFFYVENYNTGFFPKTSSILNKETDPRLS